MMVCHGFYYVYDIKLSKSVSQWLGTGRLVQGWGKDKGEEYTD